MRHYGLILRIWQTISTNFLLIKLYSVSQVLTNVVAIIFFPNVYYIINRLL